MPSPVRKTLEIINHHQLPLFKGLLEQNRGGRRKYKITQSSRAPASRLGSKGGPLRGPLTLSTCHILIGMALTFITGMDPGSCAQTDLPPLHLQCSGRCLPFSRGSKRGRGGPGRWGSNPFSPPYLAHEFSYWVVSPRWWIPEGETQGGDQSSVPEALVWKDRKFVWHHSQHRCRLCIQTYSGVATSRSCSDVVGQDIWQSLHSRRCTVKWFLVQALESVIWGWTLLYYVLAPSLRQAPWDLASSSVKWRKWCCMPPAGIMRLHWHPLCVKHLHGDATVPRDGSC